MNFKQVQQKLLILGYDLGPGKADGLPGRYTTTAIAAFQKSRKLPVKWPGTLGPMTVRALGLAEPDEPDALVLLPTPPQVAYAMTFLNKHEVRDAKFLDKAMRMDTSEIPWCGAFMGLVMANVFPSEPLPSNPLGSRNWTKFGVDAGITNFQIGAVGVFHRGDPQGWQGHVSLIIGHDDTHVHSLGGNQSNAVTVTRIAKKRLLGLRWPKTGTPLPTTPLSKSRIAVSISHNEA